MSKEKDKIYNKYNEMLNRKFKNGFFQPKDLVCDNKDEKYYFALKCFNYLFSLKDEQARIFLWNELYYEINDLDIKDFTNEQVLFFNDIKKTKQKNDSCLCAFVQENNIEFQK